MKKENSHNKKENFIPSNYCLPFKYLLPTNYL